MPRWTPWLDRTGAAVSAACALHCAGLGALMLLVPGLWLRQRQYSREIAWLLMLELALVLAAAGLALPAFGLGWRRHGRPWPMLLALPGLTLIAVGVFTPLHWMPLWGSGLVLGGGLLLVAAHLVNLWLGRRRAGTGNGEQGTGKR